MEEEEEEGKGEEEEEEEEEEGREARQAATLWWRISRNSGRSVRTTLAPRKTRVMPTVVGGWVGGCVMGR